MGNRYTQTQTYWSTVELLADISLDDTTDNIPAGSEHLTRKNGQL